MKKLLLLIPGWLIAGSSVAQDSAPAEGVVNNATNDQTLLYYIVLGLLFVCVMLTAAVTRYVLKVVNLVNNQILKQAAEKSGVQYVAAPGWWGRFTQKMNASVPVEQEKNIELEHSYDGIRELDNHLPPWWKWLFYGTIAWSVVYIVVFHLSDTLPLSLQEYENEVALAEEQAIKRKANQPATATIDENNLQYTNDPAILSSGKNVFANNPCGSCHRNDGGGNTIGPNLTDEYWIHGGDAKSIFNTIKNGAVDKGMPAWGKAMSPQDVRDLTFYILSLQGTNPPDAKAPQGNIVQQKTKMEADTTAAQASL